MRYRIVIEIDTEGNRMAINRLAMSMKDLAVTSWSNPVFVSTEQLTPDKHELYNRKESV